MPVLEPNGVFSLYDTEFYGGIYTAQRQMPTQTLTGICVGLDVGQCECSDYISEVVD